MCIVANSLIECVRVSHSHRRLSHNFALSLATLFLCVISQLFLSNRRNECDYCMPVRVFLSHGGHERVRPVSNWVALSNTGLGGKYALSSRSILPRCASDGGHFVSSGPVQSVAGYERLYRLLSVCIGCDGVAGSLRVRRDLPCRLVCE